VVDDKGRIAGIVTSDDVLRLVSGELAALGHALDTQIPGHGSAPVVAG
jgi:CBS domain-containing protein